MSLSKEFVLMKSSTMQYIEELVTRYPVLEKVKDDVVEALNMLINMYSAPYHGKILVCGNGGTLGGRWFPAL